jgi:hypothetical protein
MALKVQFQVDDILNVIPFINLRHMPSQGYVTGILGRWRQLA